MPAHAWFDGPVPDETRARLRTIPSLTGTPPELDEALLPSDPAELFLTWLEAAVAAGVSEPHVLTLSTVDAAGVPDARPLMLKDVDERGWAVAGLASSGKGRQLAGRPAAALSVYWSPVARAVRLRGPVVEASREECLADLRARPAAGQAGVDPDDWRLWWLRPTWVEFWQGSRDRDHHRIVYRLDSGGWHRGSPDE